ISAALAMDLPGPGTVYLGQNLSFRKPVMIGDELTVILEVTAKHESKPIVTLGCTVTNQDGKIVATGEATVMAPTEKMTVPVPALPPIQVGQIIQKRAHARFLYGTKRIGTAVTATSAGLLPKSMRRHCISSRLCRSSSFSSLLLTEQDDTLPSG